MAEQKDISNVTDDIPNPTEDFPSETPEFVRRVSSAALDEQLRIFLVGSRRTGTVTITSLLDELNLGPSYHGWTLWRNKNRDVVFWENV